MNLPAAETAGYLSQNESKSFLSRIGAFGAIPPEAVIRVRDKLQRESRRTKNTGFPGRHERQLGQAASSAE